MKPVAFFAVFVAAILSLAPVKADNAGPITLTVIGNVANTNRPAFDAFKDGFFKFHDKTFQKAFEFDRAALKALPQVMLTAKAEPWAAGITASGPRLKDVLAAVGVAEDAQVTLFALDGYGVELGPDDRKAEDWVLAIDVDGKPLPLGGRGPAWLLVDTADKEATADAEARWVWSVFLIAAE